MSAVDRLHDIVAPLVEAADLELYDLDLASLTVDGLQQVHRVDRVDEGRATHDLLHLVGLKRPDEVPRHVWEQGSLADELLRAVLPEVGHARRDGLGDLGDADRLGHGHHRHVPRIASGDVRRITDLTEHRPVALGYEAHCSPAPAAVSDAGFASCACSMGSKVPVSRYCRRSPMSTALSAILSR